jgi:hypothetical protein
VTKTWYLTFIIWEDQGVESFHKFYAAHTTKAVAIAKIKELWQEVVQLYVGVEDEILHSEMGM